MGRARWLWCAMIGALWGGNIGLAVVPAAVATGALAGLSWRWPACRPGLAGVAFAWLAWLTTPAMPPLAAPVGPVMVTGDVVEVHDGVWRLEDATIDGQPVSRPVRLRAELGVDHPEEGARVRVLASVRPRKPWANPGIAPAWPGEAPRWTGAALESPEIVVGSDGSPVRRALGARIRMPSETAAALLKALLLGERSDLPPDLRERFADTGTAHLLAISGLHLAVIGLGLHRLLTWLLLWWPAFRQVGRPRAHAAVLAVGLTWAYALTIARSQATLRAAVFLSLLLLGLRFARRPRGPRTLLLAACALTVADPRVPFGASFQLSFAAAAALIFAAPWLGRLARWLEEPGRLPSPAWRRPTLIVAGLAGTTTVCFVVTAPLAIAWFGQLAPVGLLVNLVAVPLVSLLVVPVGAVWLLLSVVAPGLAEPLAFLAQAPAIWLVDLVDGWSRVAGSSHVAAWPHALGVLATIAVIALLHRRTWRPAAAALALVGVALVWPAPQRLAVTALDVGHGDAIVVRLPEGQTIVMDTGGSRPIGRRTRHADRWLATAEVRPALARLGVSRIDLLVISHAHHDHVGAAAELAARVPVGELWLSPCGTKSRATTSLAANVIRSGGRVRVVGRGPPISWGGVTLTVRWPTLDHVRADGSCRSGLNDASIVLDLAWAGRRVLLTGDIEADAERALLPDLPHANVLKVPHHGSRTSSGMAFLDAVRPELAIVPGNLAPGRMPPHQSVLRRYMRRGIALWETGRDGAIEVTVEADGAMAVSRPGQPRWPP